MKVFQHTARYDSLIAGYLEKQVGGDSKFPKMLSLQFERVEMLREAFRRTARDPAFLEAAEKLAIPINPMDGEALQAMIAEFATYPKALLDRTRATVAQ